MLVAVTRSCREHGNASALRGQSARPVPEHRQDRGPQARHVGRCRIVSRPALPGNRLEALRGRRAGQHSIRINDQWRICFVWTDGAEDVEIVDYH
jgi:RelE-like toxin of type II toxin-antitoxin system HigB